MFLFLSISVNLSGTIHDDDDDDDDDDNNNNNNNNNNTLFTHATPRSANAR